MGARAPRHRLAGRGAEAQRGAERVGQGLRVAGLTRQPVRASGGYSGGREHRLGHRAEVGDDDRRAHRLRLDRRAAERLRLGRRNGDDRRRPEMRPACRRNGRRGETTPLSPALSISRVESRLNIAGASLRDRRRGCSARPPAPAPWPSAASISTLWPFQPVSRAATSTMRSSRRDAPAVAQPRHPRGDRPPRAKTPQNPSPRWMTRSFVPRQRIEPRDQRRP